MQYKSLVTEEYKKKSSLLRDTGKIRLVLELILILSSLLMFLLSLIIDRLDTNFQFLVKTSIAPGVLITPIEDISFYTKECVEEYESVDAFSIKSSFFDVTQLKEYIHHHLDHPIDLSKDILKKIKPGKLETFDGNIICIKRFDRMDFNNISTFVKKEDPCPKGYQLCGKLSNEYQSKLCIINKRSCPINLISIRDILKGEEDEFIESKLIRQGNYTKFKFDSSVFEFFNNN